MLKDFKRRQNKNNNKYVKDCLKDLGLYPLKKSKAVILAGVLGHLFSDGSLVLKNRCAFFSGNFEDMSAIKKDIELLGFKCNAIKPKIWKNGGCWVFSCFNIVFLSIMYSLGAPVGKKTDNYFILPSWIVNGDEDVKKSFISSFFGGEGYKPMFQGRSPKPILIAQSKREDLVQNLSIYLEQW